MDLPNFPSIVLRNTCQQINLCNNIPKNHSYLRNNYKTINASPKNQETRVCVNQDQKSCVI